MSLNVTGAETEHGMGSTCDADSAAGSLADEEDPCHHETFLAGLPETLPCEGEIGEYVRQAVLPQIAPPPYGAIHIQTLCRQKPVYLFLETCRGIETVGKLFACRLIPAEEAWPLAEREYSNLKMLRRQFGMDSGAYQVVAPLGKNQRLRALLVTEKAPGRPLDYYIAKAIHEQQPDRLFSKLSYLARFFVKLHRNSETEREISPDTSQHYLEKLLNSLGETILTPGDRREAEARAARWWTDGVFRQDREVVVHGDATPTNFLFKQERVIAVDLERTKHADRCWDLGFVAAELKHHFMWRMGNGWSAEPFIGHFLWEYGASYGDTGFFHRITERIPVYMALGLLRIARNSWLDEGHRRDLLAEALQCLRYAR